MVLWVRIAPDAQGRLGVIASKKTFRRAVDRNRAKRRVREAFRRLGPELPHGGWDVVIVTRRRILTSAGGSVSEELKKLLKRGGFATGET